MGGTRSFAKFASQGRGTLFLRLGMHGNGTGSGSRDPARRVARYVRLRATEWTPFKAAHVQLRPPTGYGGACRPRP
jgi:hypothetical protein